MSSVHVRVGPCPSRQTRIDNFIYARCLNLALIFAVLPGLGVTLDSFTNPQTITKYGWTLPVFNWLDVVFGVTGICGEEK